MRVDQTHDPDLRSWVESANIPASDFPLQNLPFGRFRAGATADWRIGVAIGEQVLDLQRAGLVDSNDMATLMQQAPAAWRALRQRLSAGLRADSSRQAQWQAALLPQSSVQMGLPCEIRGYTDFYTSIYHATTVGRQFRPDNPLLPNYKYVPIGYHGRASSIVLSGAEIRRPSGQALHGAAKTPTFGPSEMLDYEAEIGFFVGKGNALGEPVSIEDAEDHIFGICIVNDWSARDIQSWEYQPLGPFLSKNFATSISPWVVTWEALEPFRAPAFFRPPNDPQPLPYLASQKDKNEGGIDLTIEVYIRSMLMREGHLRPSRLSTASLADMYWTPAQMLTHHTSNGCNMHPGDLFASGTVSGPEAGSQGCLLELTRRGAEAIVLPTEEERRFLHDGDEIIMRAFLQREGAARIGLGEVHGLIVASASR